MPDPKTRNIRYEIDGRDSAMQGQVDGSANWVSSVIDAAYGLSRYYCSSVTAYEADADTPKRICTVNVEIHDD